MVLVLTNILLGNSEYANFYVHADHHEIIFDESNPGRICSATMVECLVMIMENFVTMNRGYGVTQFYTVDYSKDGKLLRISRQWYITH